MQLRNASGLLCAALIAAAGGEALAQAGYPARPVRIIVPSSAGGGTDIIARIITPKLSERLGQQVVVDNRPGAGSIIGNEIAAKSPPDGYTLLMAISTIAIHPSSHKKLPYDALRDFAPVTQTVSAPNILVVHPSLPVKSVKELISLARARPGQLNFGSAGSGTNPHLSMELFLSMAGLKMVHIPYKGSAPAIIDLLAGHVVVMTATMLTGIPHVRSGRLRALGITGAKRSGAVPEIPTVAETGLPGYEAVQWYGVLVPAQTPRDMIARLHSELVAVLQSPDIKQKFLSDGADPIGNTPEEFARFIRSETDKWAKVVRAAGIKPE
ncbi:MAG: tripartite tricarboxylate transporter substrate binding protein [Betaproteobacteria bacterium]|nr:tripartite tricarboxylate transporter substrate binding protein [Betaproteobacteria bacterium]